MNDKTKMIKVIESTHTLAKAQAAKANMSLMDYIDMLVKKDS